MEYAKKKCRPIDCYNHMNCDYCLKKGSYTCPQSYKHSGGWGWFPPHNCRYDFKCRYMDLEGNCNYHIN